MVIFHDPSKLRQQRNHHQIGHCIDIHSTEIISRCYLYSLITHDSSFPSLSWACRSGMTLLSTAGLTPTCKSYLTGVGVSLGLPATHREAWGYCRGGSQREKEELRHHAEHPCSTGDVLKVFFSECRSTRQQECTVWWRYLVQMFRSCSAAAPESAMYRFLMTRLSQVICKERMLCL